MEKYLGALLDPVYQETIAIVLGVLFVGGLGVYFLRQKNYYFIVSWASIKSWLFVAPILFILYGLAEPSPLIVTTVLAIIGAKIFFQLMGMFHRNYFVLICYGGIIGLGVSTHYNREDIFNLMPMIVLGLTCLVPLMRNNYKRMIQYIALTNLSFAFLGWAFMHLGLIMQFEKGLYQAMYLIILTEICDNTNLALSRYFGHQKLFDRIDFRRTYGSTAVAVFITLIVAFAMRHLLPDSSEKYWLMAGLISAFGGVIGDMVMTAIRKDAGIKIVGAFVLGRGDFLHRMDRMIFVAPLYYYAMILFSGGFAL